MVRTRNGYSSTRGRFISFINLSLTSNHFIKVHQRGRPPESAVSVSPQGVVKSAGGRKRKSSVEETSMTFESNFSIMKFEEVLLKAVRIR
jgi:hypothetical protein